MRDREGEKSQGEVVTAYTPDGSLQAKLKKPPSIFICNYNEYYASKRGNGWFFAIATTQDQNAFMSSLAGDRANTFISFLRYPDAKTLPSVTTLKPKPLLPSLASQKVNVEKPSVNTLSLDHPNCNEAGSKCSFREINRVSYDGKSPEKAVIASVWIYTVANAKWRLLDFQAWYEGLNEQHYSFAPADKKLDEQPARFRNWGVYREMVPKFSPAGNKIAYIKNNSIVIKKVEP